MINNKYIIQLTLIDLINSKMIPFALLIILFASDAVLAETFLQSNKNVTLEPTNNGIKLQVYNEETGKVVLKGTLGVGKDMSDFLCTGELVCKKDNVTFTYISSGDLLDFTWETESEAEIFRDCFDFQEDQWYGGPERTVQTWPIQTIVINGSKPYTSRRDDNQGVAERYWLNSQGTYIFVDQFTPLFVSQNEEDSEQQVCFIAKLDAPYINRTRNILHYSSEVKNDPKQAHIAAVNNFLGKPTAHPNAKMIAEPIWTTWAKYYRNIDDSVVLEYAQSIRNQGYENGQIEIDDGWEECYGAQEFSKEKFPSIVETVQKLKDLNFRVTLWIHPFVNDGCQPNADYGAQSDYYVKGVDGLNNASWWNGDYIAHLIDFTKPEAAEWWSKRLRKLQDEIKIDSFKFDAGETDYAQQPSVFPEQYQELIPNIMTSSYIKTCSKFGDLIEVRSASGTQNEPMFVRMLDKDSNWGWNNGLPTLVTTLFQLNFNGYPMVLPDMVAGNGYTDKPTPELLVRWTQANTFMPAMQFSYLPWELTSDDFDVPGIVQRYVKLHEQYSDVIIKAMEKSIKDGTPVNAPIWWVDPTDTVALACNDEYLLGEEILVAPVMELNSRSRKVYLPKGTWTDGQNGDVHIGPVTLDYEADIDILPFFFLTKS